MVEVAENTRTRVHSADMREPLVGVAAFFSVGAKLLDPEFRVPQSVKERVEKDLALIEKHEGFNFSAALPHGEDFSQYVPRGHYTRNEQFRRYFKAMMWYGRRMFRIESERWRDGLPPPCQPDKWSDDIMLRETRQLLLITYLLQTTTVNGKPGTEIWESLYRPTVLFAGRTEDLNVAEVKSIAAKVWGRLPGPGELGDEKKLREFVGLARKATAPKVDSSGAARKGFCFMGQRFTPDSYAFQCLVTDTGIPFGGVRPHPLNYTGKRDPRPFTWGITAIGRECRCFPRGLDILAVFGSDEALAILKDGGDTEYAGHDSMMSDLRVEMARMMDERKSENLYYGWLHALIPLLEAPKGGAVPGFLRTKAWTRKQLATALASWAELRHDTILYVKQSYAPAERAVMRPREVRGYVEPYPETYDRIARMIRKMRTDLAALGAMPEGLDGNYRSFEDTVSRLAAISRKELADSKVLTPDEYRFISYVAGRLKSSTRLPRGLRKKILSETDSKMALIADVHTDNNSGQVLEEGVGPPFLLTVRMSVEGEPTTLRGAVFSYYEFKWPKKDRLTDEKWQEILADEKTRPALPDPPYGGLQSAAGHTK